ncbi:MAG: hypothetical protein D4R43_04140 [Sphingobacteriales bacterium]|nr:MAG: hypothetical protein D4R43_04140 [Sphingobacteriales bacterium]
MAATIDTIEIITATLNFLFEVVAMKYDFSIFVKVLFFLQIHFSAFSKKYFKKFLNYFPTIFQTKKIQLFIEEMMKISS